MKRNNNGFIGRMLCALGASLLMLQAATAQPSDPQLTIQDAAKRLRAELQEDRERLLQDPAYVYHLADRLLLPHIDMERMSRLVLGRYWRTASSRLQASFTAQFTRLLVRSYSAAIREAGEWEMRFLPIRRKSEDNRFVVPSEIVRSGAQPVAVDYHMHLKDGRWLAYDLKIEGVSLVTNYRSSFARIIRQRGIDGLIAELQAKTEAAAAGAGDRVAMENGAG